MLLLSLNSYEKDWVKFYKEIVKIECYSDSIHVSGEYFFENTRKTVIAAQLMYPFPVNKVYNYPYFISVKDHIYSKTEDGIKLNINLKPLEKKLFQIDYKQRTLSKSAEYILNTSLNWKESIQEAIFYITVPKSFKNVKISYSYQEKTVKNKTVIYKIILNNLRTKRNITVSWE